MGEVIFDIDKMANASIDELEALAAEGENLSGEKSDVEPGSSTGAEDGKQETEPAGDKSKHETKSEGDDNGADKSESDHKGDDGQFVETKDGKGKIPYSELQRARSEAARYREQLETMQKEQAEKAVIDVEKIDARLAEISTEMKSLREQYESGDLEWEEYVSKADDLMKERDGILVNRTKADTSREIASNIAKKSWDDKCANFLDTQKANGVDYRGNAEWFSDLDSMLKTLAKDEANAGKPDEWFLETAHAIVMVKHGITPTTKKQQQHDTDNKGKEKVNDQSKDDRLFNTLSDIPGGEIMKNTSDVDSLAQMSGAAITNRFLKDPSFADKILEQI